MQQVQEDDCHLMKNLQPCLGLRFFMTVSKKKIPPRDDSCLFYSVANQTKQNWTDLQNSKWWLMKIRLKKLRVTEKLT